ncbi:urease accessory protein UreF [Sporosarcina pasteurii]|nr:urease accessory protein UreF [Sporosarcina pasteurii]MDS9471649.1 urease accessory protein UreF [Sporosarcina pasteurii]SUJ11605.1 Urease accessory protein UreF [Sporosarcina pasteurii]
MNNQREGSKNHSNIEATNTNPWLLHLIQIHDTAFPTGSFAHSFGMETYIQESDISNEDDLKAFCDMYLRQNLASTDAIIAQEAYRLAKENDLQGLIRLENICHAIKLSPETRKGSMMMGRQFLQTVQPLNNSELFTIWCEKLKNKEIKSHYPVVYGIYTAMLGVDLRTSLETFLYSSITSLVQNGVRAIPLGQNSGVQTIFSLLPVIQETTSRVMTLDLEHLDNNSIGLEIASMKHEFLHSRLFIS